VYFGQFISALRKCNVLVKLKFSGLVEKQGHVHAIVNYSPAQMIFIWRIVEILAYLQERCLAHLKKKICSLQVIENKYH
jgi:hypothetical protein